MACRLPRIARERVPSRSRLRGCQLPAGGLLPLPSASLAGGLPEPRFMAAMNTAAMTHVMLSETNENARGDRLPVRTFESCAPHTKAQNIRSAAFPTVNNVRCITSLLRAKATRSSSGLHGLRAAWRRARHTGIRAPSCRSPRRGFHLCPGGRERLPRASRRPALRAGIA